MAMRVSFHVLLQQNCTHRVSANKLRTERESPRGYIATQKYIYIGRVVNYKNKPTASGVSIAEPSDKKKREQTKTAGENTTYSKDVQGEKYKTRSYTCVYSSVSRSGTNENGPRAAPAISLTRGTEMGLQLSRLLLLLLRVGENRFPNGLRFISGSALRFIPETSHTLHFDRPNSVLVRFIYK